MSVMSQISVLSIFVSVSYKSTKSDIMNIKLNFALLITLRMLMIGCKQEDEKKRGN